MEYLGRVVCNSDGYLYPDSVVGAYSNSGLGVVGWEVGGLEAEAAILGQVATFVSKVHIVNMVSASNLVIIDSQSAWCYLAWLGLSWWGK